MHPTSFLKPINFEFLSSMNMKYILINVSLLCLCEIPHLVERGTKHSLQGCGNLSLVVAF